MQGQLSADLRAILAGLAEASASDGRPRYSQATNSRLRRSIAARYFAQTIYELVHFVRILGPTTEKSMISLFTLDRPTPEGFKQLCSAGHQTQDFSQTILVQEHGVECNFSGDVFVVTFKRMPYLSCFADFLITSLGWDVYSGVLDEPEMNVKQQSNKLSNLLNNWLNQHLPMRQSLRKFRAIAEFAQRHCDNDADEQIFCFWEHVNHGPEHAVDFRLYQTVALSHSHFWAAQKLSKSNISLNEQLEDFDAEKIDAYHGNIAELDGLLGDQPAHELALERIKNSPLKLLSDKEIATIEALLQARGEDGQMLTKTTCRLKIITPRQQYLSGKSKKAPDEINYVKLSEYLRDFMAELNGLLHALLRAACDGLVKKNDMTNLRKIFLSQAHTFEHAPKRISRRGFAELKNGDQEMIIAAGTMLSDMQILLGELKKLTHDLSLYAATPNLFQQDQARFTGVFAQIYGGQNG